MNFFSRGRMSHALIIIWLSLLSGCVAYTPKPIDWEQEQKNWQPHNAEPMILTLGDLLTLANVANPEINRVRMRHASLKREAHAAGWWDDPSLDVEVSRFLKGGGWTRAAGVSLVIPLTGIPGLERKAAEAYAGAGAFEVLLAEKKLEADVREAWVELAAAVTLAEWYDEMISEVEEFYLQSMVLAHIGELSAENSIAMDFMTVEVRVARVAARTAVPQKRAVLLELAGIHPLQQVEFKGLHYECCTGFAAFVEEKDLISHPAVMAKLAEFNATEQQLWIEIKKQWPEVSLGPTLEHDGEWKGGLAFGVTLPLWNRNRTGIASAEGLRNEARQECIEAWRSLVYELHQAREEKRAIDEESHLMNVMFYAGAPISSAWKLYELGEMDAVEFFELALKRFEFTKFNIEHRVRSQIAKIRAVGKMLAVENDRIITEE